jgi:hypothetical protein
MAEETPAAGDDGIMDITDTPDVAVWAKGIGKNAVTPSDIVKEPSKVASVTLYQNTKEDGEILVDAANKREVAKALAKHTPMTDESGHGK